MAGTPGLFLSPTSATALPKISYTPSCPPLHIHIPFTSPQPGLGEGEEEEEAAARES